MKTHDAAGGQCAPSKSKYLPNRILRAIDAAMHSGSLPRRLRPTLAQLVRFVSQDRPFETIFAKKETIALRTDSSVETIYRHLSALRELGLIETLDQERKSRNGRYAVSRIRLTAKCAELVGLVSSAEQPLPETVLEAAPVLFEASVSQSEPPACGSATSEVIHNPPSVKMTCRHTLTEPTISKSQPTRRTQNGLPMDLTWLTRNGLSRSGIFKLMSIAKQAGKRLSDVVTAVYDRIESIKGARLYAYLKALASGPTDFAVAAANARRAIEATKQEQRDRAKVALFRQRFRGTALTNRAQTKLFVIDDKCAFVQVHSRNRVLGSSPLNDLREWIAGIESGAIVFATLAVERQFARF